MTENNNVFEEYQKFLHKDVVVEYFKGDKVEKVEGNLRFLSFSYLSCVVMTDTDKIIIKNIITISRKRKNEKEK